MFPLDMSQETLLKYGTFGVLTVALLVLVKPMLSQQEKSGERLVQTTGSDTAYSDTAEHAADIALLDPPQSYSKSALSLEEDLDLYEVPPKSVSANMSRSTVQQVSHALSHDPILQVGRIADVPTRKELTLIKRIPATEAEIKRVFDSAQHRSCKILGEGVLVDGPLSMMPGQRSSAGRINAVTIGLELVETGRGKLPGMVINEVVKYFADHRLTVQPMLYYDDTGKFYFGNECKAAFYETRHANSTITPEPMIATAVAQFRVLGIVDSGDTAQRKRFQEDPSVGRTMALAFAFEQAGESGFGTSKRQRAHELMWLHIPSDFNLEQPSVDVFVTSDHGRVIHRLGRASSSRSSLSSQSAPAISASVKFDKTTLLGMYPADPVVSGIQYRSGGHISMQKLQKLLATPKSDGGMTASAIFDNFESIAKNDSIAQAHSFGNRAELSLPEQPFTPLSDDWIEAERLKRQREFQNVFQSALELSDAE